MAVQWNDEFKTGIQVVDAQHYGLIQKLGELSVARRSGEGVDQAVCEQILALIRDYIVVHFATEEQMMNTTAYPGLAGHKREHGSFIEQFERINAKAKTTARMPAEDVEKFLLRWVNGHILIEDVKMSAFLISKGIS